MDRQAQLRRLRKSTIILALPPRPDKTPPTEEPTEERRSSRLSKFAWLAAIVGLLVTGAFFRFHNASESTETTSPSEALRQVNVVTPVRHSGGDLGLPGTILAYQATDLFARANGFLKSWKPEIGTVVKKGDVLAEIETPELDQELAQAIALLAQGRAEHQQSVAELQEARADVVLAQANVVKVTANVDYAVSQASRYEKLVRSNSVSRQEYEGMVRERDANNAELDSSKAELQRRKTNLATRQAIIDSKEAVVKNREANVQRLRDLTGFRFVVAPFDGVVTRRSAEVGMLVSAGSNTGTQPLFSIAQIDVLRVQVAVPQSSALEIKPGDAVQVTIPEKPGQPLAAKVTRTAGAVEPTSRSLLVEVELPNRDAKLLPGVYSLVRFRSTRQQTNWVIPGNTIVMRTKGPQVVVVNEDGTLRTQPVTLGRDFGTTTEVVIGLTGSERLVVNPSGELHDGQRVHVSDSATSQIARK